MIKSGLTPRPATFGAKIQSSVRSTWFFSLIIAVLVTVAATPPPEQSPDEFYIQIMALIDRADALRTAGQTNAAQVKYAEAEKALIYFKATNPLFAPQTVAYRLKEVTERADARPPVPESKSTEKPKANLEAPAASAKSGVKLIDAGAEPRSALRFHLKAGDKQTAVLTMKIKMDMPMPAATPGGAPPATPTIPAISIPMDMTVQSVAANGDIAYESVMGEASIADEPGATPAVVQAMKTALAGMKGLTSTGVMSNRGVSKKTDVKLPGNADPTMRQTMDQMKDGMGNLNVPFPEEPVGVGAKWESKNVTKVQAISVEQTGTYELVSHEGDRLSTKFTMAFNAASPAAGKGPTASLQLGGNSTGTANLDLSKLVGSATIDMRMESPMGKNQTMKMDINMSLEPR